MDSLGENHKEFMKSNTSILKSQQRFKSKKHNVFAEKVNKIALSTNDGKRSQSIDSTETYAYGTNEDVIHKKEKIKYINIIKHYKKWLTMMMLQKKTKYHNSNWP